MKQVWKNIQDAVNASPLNEKEKSRVLSKIDEVLGRSLLEDHIPITNIGLSLNEYIIYRDIIEAINISKSIISSDSDYEAAVEQIFQIRKGNVTDLLRKFMLKMDDHYKNNDWKGVNIYWKKIKEIL